MRSFIVRWRVEVACCTVAFVVACAVATSAHAASKDYAEGDCHWREQGDVLHINGVEFHCACGRLTLPSGRYRVFCRWQKVVPSLRKHKPINRYGISTGVLA